MNKMAAIELRRIPYPYRAMLAICSDLDETPDWRTYYEMSRFLNTTETTAMGPGVGLEVGNSIYFDMPPDQFAYWNTDDQGREIVRALIRSGHIDCLHSYGDLATTRSDAERALEELDRHDCRLAVWVDHGTAPTNLGRGIMRGRGDVLGDEAYHADLTTSYGIRYVWTGRVTSVLGQDVPTRYGGILRARHPVRSGKTLAKEVVKHGLAHFGHRKYAMHADNQLTRPIRLQAGQQVLEFIRCNPHWGGVSCCDTARDIGQVLSEDALRRLAARGGMSILYTHLGKVDDPARPFGPEAVAAFRRLAEARDRGDVLVTTTRRLLDFRRMVGAVSCTRARDRKGARVDVTAQSADHRDSVRAEDLDFAGLTMYVDRPEEARVFVDGRHLPDLQVNGPDETGRTSVSVPWTVLRFPGASQARP